MIFGRNKRKNQFNPTKRFLVRKRPTFPNRQSRESIGLNFLLPVRLVPSRCAITHQLLETQTNPGSTRLLSAHRKLAGLNCFGQFV